MFGKIPYTLEQVFVLSKHVYTYNTAVTDVSAKDWL